MLATWPLWVSFLAFMNGLTFVLFGVDKARAKAGAWRIAEKTLFFCCLFGGALGGWAGMRCFHHKTRHPLFACGVPLLTLLQLAVLAWLFFAKGGVR